MYVKIKNGVVEKYPYSIFDLKNDNPNVSFPFEIPESLLNEYGVFSVVLVQCPDTTYTKNVVEDKPVLIDDKWTQQWAVIDKSAEEINAIQEANRKQAYIDESDPIFFKWQRGEATQQDWLDKVNEIKQRWI
ncbi:hypothetical protein UFOVP369_40 [uncultured Caudovirales phage]|uniref:Phage tail assembly chaperone protein n=1 Tax=uncultured Caudovirales phage TaxID=2100421 RepID=A0A6J7X6K5_9CAUD|nr:hypothetical protein UFOVP369_40 [uncultured Caudovirales phage]